MLGHCRTAQGAPFKKLDLSQIVRQHEEVDRVTVQREHPPVETTAEQRVIKTTIMQRKSPGSTPRPVVSSPVCCQPLLARLPSHRAHSEQRNSHSRPLKERM